MEVISENLPPAPQLLEHEPKEDAADPVISLDSQPFGQIVSLPNVPSATAYLFSVPRHRFRYSEPDRNVLQTDWSTYYVIKLVSAVKLDRAVNRLLPTPEELILQQAKFIASLTSNWGRDLQTSMSLRLIGYPDPELPQRGKVLLGFVCRVTTQSRKQSLTTALYSVEASLSVLPGAEKQIYQFAPVASENEFMDFFDPFPIQDLVEIRRREQTAVIGHHAEAYVIHPLYHKNNFVPLLWNLLRAPAPHLIDISISPTELLPWERQGIEDTIALCGVSSTETEMESAETDGKLRGVTRYKASMRANAIRRTYQHILDQLEAQAFVGKVHIASPSRLAPNLVDAVAVEISGMPDYSADESQVGAGGYHVCIPLSSEDFHHAEENIKFGEHVQWDYSVAPDYLARLRQLYGLGQAICIFRIPIPTEEGLPGVKVQEVKYAPLPAIMPTEGIVLGESLYAGVSGPARVMIKDDDRRRHMYIVGKTGTGKSTLLMQMAVADIERGAGVCVIDPHGELVEEILVRIPPDRAADVVLFDPSDTERPIGVNMLETHSEAETHLVVNEMIGLMYKLYDPNRIGIVGPRFEHAVRNSMLTVMAEPGNTLIEVVRVLTNSRFREQKLRFVTDPLVRSYWLDQVAQTSDFHKSEVLDYIVSKFGRFVTNHLVRNIIGQSQSSFDYRRIMDERGILLVNLSKGRIGPENSIFLGSIIVPKLLISALSRVDIAAENRSDFYLYVDEFQNFASETFATMLSEARKYGISITLANQYLSQLPVDVLHSVFGNVGSVIAFRIGTQDIQNLGPEFYPVFDGDDLSNLPKYTTCVKLLVDGMAARQFSMRTVLDRSNRDEKNAAAIRQISRLRYGRPKELVEQEIAQRFD